jgi:hypothetical protein
MSDFSASPDSPTPPPTIHEASLRRFDGAVIRGNQISQADAEARRKSGLNVVVCGTVPADNRMLARQIETNANGAAIYCPPHFSTGSQALPHYHPKSRGLRGHTFFETNTEKAV